MRKIAAIAVNTFREAIRNKILYALLFFAVALIMASIVVARLSLHEEIRVIEDLGLAATSLFSVLIAVFVGVNLVYKELERKTVFFIIPKPIYRWEFLWGKLIGTSLTLAVLVGVMALVFFGVLMIMGGGVRVVLLKAVWLYYVEVLIISTVALFFSSFSSPFLSGLFTILVFVVGRLTPDIEMFIPRMGDEWLKSFTQAVMYCIPDLNLFNVSGAVVDGEWVSIHGEFVTWLYVGKATAYGLIYGGIVMFLAMAVFRRRDFV
jgi:ABC-type transport system involved in multi-copper enzyme maturation permease subunit